MAPIVVRGYGRASTETQVLSPQQQEAVELEAFKVFCKIKPGWSDAIWGGFFFDEAITRTSRFRQRPVGSLLLAMTKPGDVIMAANFDRIFANVGDVCETFDLIDERKFQIVVLDLDIPLDTNLGQAVFKILAAVKELEAKEIRRRNRDSASFRKAKGLPYSKPPIGWRCVKSMLRGQKQSHFVPNEDARDFARKLLAKRAAHPDITIKAFTRMLNDARDRNFYGLKWNQVTIKKWIDAAIAGFPLKNGSHDPVPIPADADPISTIGDPR